MQHITQAKQAMKDLIVASLPAALTAADAEANDGITCDPPSVVYRAERTTFDQFPAMELICTESIPVDNSDYARIYRHRVLVGVTIGGDDEQTLTTQVERYIWTLRRMLDGALLQATNSAFYPGPMDAVQEAYTPATPGVQVGLQAPFVKSGYVEVFVLTLE